MKKAAPTVSNAWLVFSRGMISLVAISCWGVIRRDIVFLPKNGALLLIVRGIAGYVGVTSLFYGVTHLPLPVAAVFNWSSPIFVVLFSRLFLSERLPSGSRGLVLLAFVGLTQVVGLRFDEGFHSLLPWFPALVGLLGAVAAGVAYTAIRAASAQFSSNTIIFYFSLMTSLLAAPFAFFSSVPFQTGWTPVLLLVGASATLGQICMTHAYRYAPAGVVSVLSLMNAPFSALLGYWVFGEVIELWQWFGIFILGVAVSGVALLQQRRVKGVTV